MNKAIVSVLFLPASCSTTMRSESIQLPQTARTAHSTKQTHRILITLICEKYFLSQLRVLEIRWIWNVRVPALTSSVSTFKCAHFLYLFCSIDKRWVYIHANKRYVCPGLRRYRTVLFTIDSRYLGSSLCSFQVYWLFWSLQSILKGPEQKTTLSFFHRFHSQPSLVSWRSCVVDRALKWSY